MEGHDVSRLKRDRNGEPEIQDSRAIGSVTVLFTNLPQYLSHQTPEVIRGYVIDWDVALYDHGSSAFSECVRLADAIGDAE